MFNHAIRMVKNYTSLKALILMYHRIDKEGMDPWGLCVTPEHFAEQLETIQKYAKPISLETLITNLKNNKVTPNSIVVTFDDGYTNNLTFAQPLLKTFNIPATFFITTGMINGICEFWWDELEQILLKPRILPDELILEIAGVQHCWKLGKAASYTENEYKDDFHQKPWESREGTRLQFYYSVWHYLHPLNDEERTKLIQDIAQWANTTLQSRKSHSLLKETELQVLSRNELFEIGAHTYKHPSLPKLNKEQQAQEILCSKEALEKIVQRKILSFAYPHGEYSDDTIDILISAGFQCACATEETRLSLRQNLFKLPRFQVEDWNGKTFRKVLHDQFGMI